MINNNTQNKPQTSTKTSESTIYLKKSELPSNVSSFKNDAGYITSSSLDIWLKEHSYIPKNEINTLISKVDISNKSIDGSAIKGNTSDIAIIKGEIVGIKDVLDHINDSYIDIDKLSDFVTKTELNQVSERIDSIDLSNFATKNDINGLATESWVESQNYLKTHQSLAGYVKTSDLTNRLNGYAQKSNVYTKGETDSIFLTKKDASETFPTKSEVNSTYLKKRDAAATYLRIEDYKTIKNAVVINTDYKDKTLETLQHDLDILRDGFYVVNNTNVIIIKDHNIVVENGSTDPGMSDYVKVEDLADYAKKEELFSGDYNDLDNKPTIPSKVSDLDNDAGYLTEHQDLTGYATEQWVENQGYVKEVPQLVWLEI